MKKSSKRKVKDRTAAKAWMVTNHIKQRDIQIAVGHSTSVQTSETLRGIRSSRDVLQYLLDKGCPSRYLALPKDMQEAKK